MNKSMKELLPMAIMKGRRVAVSFLLCVSVLHPLNNAVAQNVKSTFDRSVDFTKYKKYAWGSNYLLTRQTKEDQERINMAIIDSINRNLQALGFVEDDKNPDFRIKREGSLKRTWVRSGTCTPRTWLTIPGVTSEEFPRTYGFIAWRNCRSR
jgi:hypothetical protein